MSEWIEQDHMDDNHLYVHLKNPDANLSEIYLDSVYWAFQLMQDALMVSDKKSGISRNEKLVYPPI